MSSCSGNCSTCGSDCSDRKAESLLAKLNDKASVKQVIAVVSGKGGVGKSTVTALIRVEPSSIPSAVFDIGTPHFSSFLSV